MSTPFLRVATLSDLPAIVAIHNQAIVSRATAHRAVFSVDDRIAWFDSHDSLRRPILVAENEGTVLGWASLSDYRPGRPAVDGCGEISFFVHEDHRRRGIATLLVKECIARSPTLGVDHLLAILLATNEGSALLLHRCGFEEWGRLPGVVSTPEGPVDHLYLGRWVGPDA